MDLADLNPTAHGQVGNLPKFYFAKSADIETFATASASAVPGDSMKYDEDFVMKTGKKFFEGKTVAPNAILINWPVQGPVKGKSFKHRVEINIAAIDPATLEIITELLNEDLVLIVPDKNDKMRIVGTENLPAYCTEGEGTTGKSGEDEIGQSIVFETENKYPPFYYEGAVPLVEAV